MLSKHKFRIFLPIIIAIIIVIIIEYLRWFTNYVVEYDRLVRDFEHFIAGIIFPYYFLVTDDGKPFKKFKSCPKINFYCLGYSTFCACWELVQFLKRGYFQYDQLLGDIIGTVIILMILKIK